jgi:hypothetical protein
MPSLRGCRMALNRARPRLWLSCLSLTWNISFDPAIDTPGGIAGDCYAIDILALLHDTMPLWESGCHGQVAVTGYSDFSSCCWTAGSFFSINDLISSYFSLVVPRYFRVLPVPSMSLHPLLVPTIVRSPMFSYLLAPSVHFCCVPASSSTLQ